MTATADNSNSHKHTFLQSVKLNLHLTTEAKEIAKEYTNHVDCPVSVTQMEELAQRANADPNDAIEIYEALWKRALDSGKEYPHVAKSLEVLEFFTKNNVAGISNELYVHEKDLAALMSYNHAISSDINKKICEQAKRLKAECVARLQQERARLFPMAQDRELRFNAPQTQAVKKHAEHSEVSRDASPMGTTPDQRHTPERDADLLDTIASPEITFIKKHPQVTIQTDASQVVKEQTLAEMQQHFQASEARKESLLEAPVSVTSTLDSSQCRLDASISKVVTRSRSGAFMAPNASPHATETAPRIPNPEQITEPARTSPALGVSSMSLSAIINKARSALDRVNTEKAMTEAVKPVIREQTIKEKADSRLHGAKDSAVAAFGSMKESARDLMKNFSFSGILAKKNAPQQQVIVPVEVEKSAEQEKLTTDTATTKRVITPLSEGAIPGDYSKVAGVNHIDDATRVKDAFKPVGAWYLRPTVIAGLAILLAAGAAAHSAAH